MKYIVVSGCSFSSSYAPRMDRGIGYDFVKWPYHLRDMIDCDAEVINVARSGMGNEYIYTSLKDTLLEIDPKDILLVIAAWSGCRREDWITHDPSMLEREWTSVIPKPDGYTRYSKDLDFMIAKSNNWRWSLGSLCKQLGVRLVDFNMLCSSTEESHKKDLMFDLIDPRQSISQQNAKRLGLPLTISVAELLFCNRKQICKYYWGNSERLTSYNNLPELQYEVCIDPKHRIEITDSHPNAQAHKQIAEWIYDEIQRLGH
tara:strand:+ start:1626 stop:2402 length:777 start_codon:yes stop_codon:yes gene_type:complete